MKRVKKRALALLLALSVVASSMVLSFPTQAAELDTLAVDTDVNSEEVTAETEEEASVSDASEETEAATERSGGGHETAVSEEVASDDTDASEQEAQEETTTEETIEASSYEVLEGNGQIATIGITGDLVFRFGIIYNEFISSGEVCVDDILLAPESYTTAEGGSTVITLYAAYVAGLSEGVHTLTVRTADGTASAAFSVFADNRTEHNVTIDQGINRMQSLLSLSDSETVFEATAKDGDEVSVYVGGNSRYTVTRITIYTMYFNDAIDLLESSIIESGTAEDGIYTFTMPEEDVYIHADYILGKGTRAGSTAKTEGNALTAFLRSAFPATTVNAAIADGASAVIEDAGPYIMYADSGYNNDYGTGVVGRTQFHKATIDGVTYNGFCIQPYLASPHAGATSTAVTGSDETVVKILYYGYNGPGVTADGNPMASLTADQQLIVTHATLSKYFGLTGPSGWDSTWKFGLNDAGQAAVAAYEAWIATQAVPFGAQYAMLEVAGEQTTIYVIDYGSLGHELSITKSSANTIVTNGNSYYALSGAVYTVYSDAACTSAVTTYTTDATGAAAAQRLSDGTYYVKETTAPKGYNIDTSVHTVDLTTSDQTLNVTDTPKTVDLKVNKSSALPSISNGNSLYSLSGAVYYVYKDAACTQRAVNSSGANVVLTTTASGATNVASMAYGTYYVKEITAPTGYKLDTAAHAVNMTTSNQTVPLSDTPGNDPIGLLLSKRDKETNATTPLGGGELANAVYQVTYYDAQFTNAADAASHTAKRTWKFKTDANGHIDVQYASDYVGGDALYRDAAGNVTFPLGTYLIQEIEAPEGYVLNDEIYVVNTTIASDTVTTSNLPNTDTYNAKEAVKRGDIAFRKVDGETGAGIRHHKFLDRHFRVWH